MLVPVAVLLYLFNKNQNRFELSLFISQINKTFSSALNLFVPIIQFYLFLPFSTMVYRKVKLSKLVFLTFFRIFLALTHVRATCCFLLSENIFWKKERLAQIFSRNFFFRLRKSYEKSLNPLFLFVEIDHETQAPMNLSIFYKNGF